jgi:hypothetical protein
MKIRGVISANNQLSPGRLRTTQGMRVTGTGSSEAQPGFVQTIMRLLVTIKKDIREVDNIWQSGY